MSAQLKRIEEKIEATKAKLVALGPMRPGAISKQYKLPKEKLRPYYQISYTYHMRSKTEYVRQEDVPVLTEETAAFKRFKKLVDIWVELELAASQLRIKIEREKT